MTPKNIPSSDTDDQAGGVQSIEKPDVHEDHGWSNTRPAWLRYAAAVGIVAVAVALPMVFMPTLGTRFPFITLFPAVILAALFGGLGPGLFATVFACLAANYSRIEPTGALGIADSVRWSSAGIFVANGIAVSFITGRMHRNRARLAEKMANLVNSSDDAIIGKTLEAPSTVGIPTRKGCSATPLRKPSASRC